MIFVQILDDSIVNKYHFQPKIPFFVQVKRVSIFLSSDEIKCYFGKGLYIIYINKNRLHLCPLIVILKCLNIQFWTLKNYVALKH